MADKNNSNSCNNPENNVYGLITKFCASISNDISGCGYEDVSKFRSLTYEILLTKYPINKSSPPKTKDELQKQICITQLDMRFDGDRDRKTPKVDRYEALTEVEELYNRVGEQQMTPYDSLLFMMLKLTETESKPKKISTKPQYFDTNISISPLQNNRFLPKKDYDYYLNIKKVKPRPNYFEKASIEIMKMENELKNKDIFSCKFPIPIKPESFEQWVNKEVPIMLYKKLETGPPPPSSTKLNNDDGLLKKHKDQHSEDKYKNKRSLRVLSMESAECEGTSYMRKFLSDTNYSCELLLYEAQKNGIKLELRRLSSKDFLSNLKLLAVGIQSETFIRDEKTGNFHILENTCLNGVVPSEIEIYVEPFLMCGKSFLKLNDMIKMTNDIFTADSYIYKSLCRAIDEYLNTFRQFVMLQPDNSLLSQFYKTLRTMMSLLNSLEQLLKNIPLDNYKSTDKGILYINYIWTRMRKCTKTEFITLLTFFLKRMCQVYFKLLQRWFVKAKLNDPHKDLFIQNVFVTQGGKNFFNKENNIRKSAVPLFLIGYEETILNCGKYTMLLKSFKPNHPLFAVECPEVKVCFNMDDLEATKKDWAEYMEKAQVHCKIVNMQTIFDERKALKEQIKKKVIQRHEEHLAAWKEQQKNEQRKQRSMINIWRKQREDDLHKKLKERQEKIFQELCVQRELDLLEEYTLLKKNIHLRKRIEYLKNCKYFLKEDIVTLSQNIDKDDKKQGGILTATTKRRGLTPLRDKTNILSLKKSVSLLDIKELEMEKNDVELLLEVKSIKSLSCDSIFQNGRPYADIDIISLASSNITIHDYDIVDLEKQLQQLQHQYQHQHPSNVITSLKKHSDDLDKFNSNIESTSICSQNRERMMSAQLVCDSLTYDIENFNKISINKTKPLTDLERNRQRVMTEEFHIQIPSRPPKPPIDKPLTDVERNKRHVMTEVYSTPLQQQPAPPPRQRQQQQQPPSSLITSTGTGTDINLNKLPSLPSPPLSDNNHIELSDLQINRLNILHSSFMYQGDDHRHKVEKIEPQISKTLKLTQRGINRKRVLESEYGIRLQDAYLMEKEKQKTEDHHQREGEQRKPRIVPNLHLPEQQQMMIKKDDNLDADTPMSITSDISTGGISAITTHPQCLDEFNNNNNALRSSSVLQDIKEISSDNSNDNYFMSPSNLPQDHNKESQHYHKHKVNRSFSSAENANACISLISAKYKQEYYEFCQNLKENPDQDPKQRPTYMNLYKLLDENFAYSNENSPFASFKDSPTTKNSNKQSKPCAGGSGGKIGYNNDGENPKKVTCVTHEDTFMMQNYLRESIMIPVKVHYRLVRNELMRILCEDTQIYEHFRSLRNYYFLMDGVFSEVITDGIIGRLENGSSPTQLLSFQILQTVLYKAINNSLINITKFSDNLSFEVFEIPDQFKLISPNVLDVLILSYRVQGPLSLILTTEAMEHYKMIFQFLFKIRRVNYCLDHAYQYLKGTRDPKISSSPQFRRVQLIRYKLAHFVGSLQSYLYSNVLQSSWQRFKDALCKVADIEMLYQAHANYLKEIKFLCLLNRRSGNISKQLNLILKIALRFYNVLKADEFILNPETQVYEHKRYERLLHEEKEFDEFILYLMYLGQKIVSHGYQEEISDFLRLMNLNQYYFEENQAKTKK